MEDARDYFNLPELLTLVEIVLGEHYPSEAMAIISRLKSGQEVEDALSVLLEVVKRRGG